MAPALDTLPHDVLYLLLAQTATEPITLCALASTCTAIHAVYTRHKTSIFSHGLHLLTGPNYKLALELAQRELSLPPETPPSSDALIRAFHNHTLLSRLALFMRAFHCLRYKETHAVPTPSSPPPPAEPFPSSPWLHAVYRYAAHGITERSLLYTSALQYRRHVPEAPTSPQDLNIALAYTIFISFVHLERRFEFSLRRRVLELGYSLTTSRIMRRLFMKGGWRVAGELMGVKKSVWRGWETECKLGGGTEAGRILEMDLETLLEGEPVEAFGRWVGEGLPIEGVKAGRS